MNTNKFLEFFDPNKIEVPIHIIGCGAIGSTLGVMLARCGINKVFLYDFDRVEPHNIANQQFRHEQIGLEKTEALKQLMLEIHPQMDITEMGAWEKDTALKGIVFLGVDSIELRKAIAVANRYNLKVAAMFDFRMRLIDAQHYAADWKDQRYIENFIASMDFTDEEANKETPVSACNMTLSIMPTVQTIVSLGMANFINFINDEPLAPQIIANPFDRIVLG